MHCARCSSLGETGAPFGYMLAMNGTGPELFGCTVKVKRTLPPCVVNTAVSSGLPPGLLTTGRSHVTQMSHGTDTGLTLALAQAPGTITWPLWPAATRQTS